MKKDWKGERQTTFFHLSLQRIERKTVSEICHKHPRRRRFQMPHKRIEKPSCHIRFMQSFPHYDAILKELTLFVHSVSRIYIHDTR